MTTLSLEIRLERAFNKLAAEGCPVRHLQADSFTISGEANVLTIWVDYYKEYGVRINPKIEAIADHYGLFLEFINPGILGVYDA